MKIESLLQKFYLENGIPNGGVDKDTFELKIFGLKIHVPNPEFRKRVTYIHDLHHLLNEKDTSWKGEAYISGWEISTGIVRYFPICLLSIWAMGYSLWLYPKEVYLGFKKGLKYKGPIDLKISRSEFMDMDLPQLEQALSRKEHAGMNFFRWLNFLFFAILGQVLFLLPVLLLAMFFFNLVPFQ